MNKSLNIAFWNVRCPTNSEVPDLIKKLIITKKLQLLVVCEINDIKSCISSYLPNDYLLVDSLQLCDKVMVIKHKDCDFQLKTAGNRFVILESKSLKCIVVGLHLNDNFNDGLHASMERTKTLNEILNCVDFIDHENEIFVGDFNCDPFSYELLDCDGLHAVLFKREMTQKPNSRIKRYNPMLLMLDENKYIYGSFKYGANNYPLYWHAYDQVIVSKSLMDCFDAIEYLKSIDGNSLMNISNTSLS